LPANRLIADPAGSDPIPNAPGDAAVAIGPEGGFSASELDAARRAGWHFVSLGPRILRVETAAIAFAATIAGAAAISAPRAGTS
jgi:16S rRNA (uracil1498-N3)-methyltransferase